ncbi:flagellar FlbD family protein [Alkalicoccus luteus]|uniref:Flagellar FlbD family protein n=1 Tax=Alkalicoccus luteus TaxID=1237094 RepID=A0A969PQ35_9BACI|nr:flagellar FlbD family protein [Alkalicoccus luteus]NJP36346.1 flagellar FlbD family protein [Alkalicoccus luteus]
MIEVTRLNSQPFVLNALYIEQIQSFPDTTVTLINGKKLVVLESEDQLAEKITQFYKKVGLAGTAAGLVLEGENNASE